MNQYQNAQGLGSAIVVPRDFSGGQAVKESTLGIPAALQQQEASNQMLHKLISTLEQRLTPVLRPVPASPEPSGSLAPVPNVLSQQMQNEASITHQAATRIENILSLLEI